jgi:hypothetical protein
MPVSLPASKPSSRIFIMKRWQLNRITAALLLAAAIGCPAIAKDKTKAVEKVHIPHKVIEIEGWSVHVDTSLLQGQHKKTGDLALKIVGQRLHQITLKIPAGPLKKMQEVPIYLDRKHPIGGAHFHPDGKWLSEHGYDPAMAKAVQIADVGRLIQSARRPSGGEVMIHELAHAYHNRVLGFNNKEIIEAYNQFRASGKFEMVPVASGAKRPHYGLMNPMEYFAEMTETFFAVNDFYPFVQTELANEDPHTYRLIGKIWGVKTAPRRERKLDRQDLMILATVKSKRGLHAEALKHLDEAEQWAHGNERVAKLRKAIEAAKAKAAQKK